MSRQAVLDVVVAVILDAAQHVLITKRAKHLHLGDLWEFPGGKMEAGETRFDALRRELREEVGLTVLSAKPLCEIENHDAHRAICLHVFLVDAFSGKASICEQQQDLAWVCVDNIDKYRFPKANEPILAALREHIHTSFSTNNT